MGGRADTLRAKLEAEIAVVELEDELRALKADPDTAIEALRGCKLRLRDARREYRTLRAAEPSEQVDGDAVVAPEPVKVKAGAKSPGGGR